MKKRKSLRHAYQFQGWKKSMEWRYFGQLVVLFATAIIIQNLSSSTMNEVVVYSGLWNRYLEILP